MTFDEIKKKSRTENTNNKVVFEREGKRKIKLVDKVAAKEPLSE